MFKPLDDPQKELERQNLLTWIGTGAQAAGQMFSAGVDYKSALARASVARLNAASYRLAASQSQSSGKLAAEAQRLQTSSLLAKQRAALAANGIVVDQGTALALAAQTASIGAQDAIAAVQAAENEAAAYLTKANIAEAEAANERSSGIGSLFKGAISAGTTILGAATTVNRRSTECTKKQTGG